MTLLLAWINAKYDFDYEFLFILMFIVDIQIISLIMKYIGATLC